MINLKHRRLELGLTMSEVAKAIGVSEATISRYESGNIKNMRRDRVAKYAKILQVNPSEFITEEADYLEDNSNISIEAYIKGDNSGVQAIKGETVTINHCPDSQNEIEKEICSILSKLNLRERTELLTIIYDYMDKHKKS